MLMVNKTTSLKKRAKGKKGNFNKNVKQVATVGERSISKKISMITQDLSRRCIATTGESVSMYPRRSKAEALSNAVDVVERLRDPTDQVPNVRHLRVLRTFNSMTSLEL